jgi:hypothetical protein
VVFEEAPKQVSLPVVDAQTDGYSATQNEDGTWDIHDVPFFSSHIDDRGGEAEAYPVSWLTEAVKLAQDREASDGYLGPLHVQHHAPGNQVTFAGKIRLSGVKALRFEGRPTPTIFGDLVQVPDAVFQDIKSGQLPYRSVEIKGPNDPEILSLALLDHEVPFFRYAVMQISRERSYTGGKRKKRQLVAFRAAGVNDQGLQTRSVTFDYEGAQMQTFASAEEQAAFRRVVDAQQVLAALEGRLRPDMLSREQKALLQRIQRLAGTGGTAADQKRAQVRLIQGEIAAAKTDRGSRSQGDPMKTFAITPRLKSRIDFIARTTVPDLKRAADSDDIELVFQRLQILAPEAASMLKAAQAEARSQRSQGGALVKFNSEATMSNSANFEMDSTGAAQPKAFQADPMEIIQGLMDGLQQLADALGGGAEEEPAAEEETEAPPVMASQNTPVEVRQEDAPAEAPTDLAAALGRIVALETQLGRFQDETQQQQAAAAKQSERDTAAMAFAEQGAPNEDIDTFRMLWRKEGPAYARGFADSMAKTYASRPAPPPRAFSGDLPIQAGAGVSGGLLPPEVMAYQAQGPQAFADAQRWYVAWQGSSKRHPLAKYLAANTGDAAQFFTAANGKAHG